MKIRSAVPMRIAKAGYILLSVVIIAIGTAFIVFPDKASETIIRMLGGAAVLFGIIKIVGYLSKDLYRLAFQFDLEFGIIMIAAGAVIAVHPNQTLSLLSVAVGLMTLLDGLFKLRIALDAKRFGITGWWLITALGVASVLAGGALTARPSESAAVISVMIGADLIAYGVLNLAVAVETVKIVKKQYPDVIDPEYTETEDDDL